MMMAPKQRPNTGIIGCSSTCVTESTSPIYEIEVRDIENGEICFVRQKTESD